MNQLRKLRTRNIQTGSQEIAGRSAGSALKGQSSIDDYLQGEIRRGRNMSVKFADTNEDNVSIELMNINLSDDGT